MSKHDYCIVPTCKNTAYNNPNKIFIKVPSDQTKRNLWLQAVERTSNYSSKSSIFVCEDHFNLEQDMENFLEFKTMGVRKRMKPDIVPHLALEATKNDKMSQDFVQPSTTKSEENVTPKYTSLNISQSTISDCKDNTLDISASSEIVTQTKDFAVQVCSSLIDAEVQVKPLYRSKYTQCTASTTKDVEILGSPLKTVTFDVLNNLEEDMDNYYEFQLMGHSTKKRMKRHIVPHLALGVENKCSESSVSLDPLDISQPSTSIIQPEIQPVKPTLIPSLPQNNVTLVQPVNLVPNRKYVLIPVETFNSGVFQNVYIPSPNNTNMQVVLQPPDPINILPNTNSDINSPGESLKQLTYVPNIPTQCGIPLASCSTQETSDESILPDLHYYSKREEVHIKQEEPGPDDLKVQQETNLTEDSSSTSVSYDFAVSSSSSKKLTEIMHSKSSYKAEELYKLQYDLEKQMRSQRLKEKRLKKRILRLIGKLKNLKQTKFCSVNCSA